jgi:hypothetical protein
MKSGTNRTFAAVGMASALLPAAFGQLSNEEMQKLEPRLPAPAARPVDFDREIRPIFENSCVQCHGPERPKSGFRLTSREDALKGGANGVDIVPGQSSRSPLVFYTANVVEDMEMPPRGKAPPLTTEQVGLLRAWIDQGANWGGGGTNIPPKVLFSVTPSVQWFTVKGNERQFREHTGIKEGWNGGVQSLFFQEQEGKRKLTFEGRTFVNPEEYKFKLQIEQRDLGYAQFGFEQYREYYSDTGGYFPGVDELALRRDLYLDVGRAWANFVLTLPDKPRILLGYEYQYRDGSKSILQWGDAGRTDPSRDIAGTDARKIFPSAKEIDERVHIVKFDVSHEINGIGMENRFRAEFYENNTSRESTGFYNTATGTKEKYGLTEERHEHFQASDSFFLEKQVLDWLYLSGGYYFSRLDGEYGFSTQTVSPLGIYSASDPFWFTDSIIVLEQNTHVINANTQLGPWNGLTIFGGVQSDWMSQRGFGNVRLDEGIPGALEPEPATVDSDLDRVAIDEHLGLRYTKIPFTVLFAEARLSQESIGQYENQFGGDHEFLRDTDATSDMEEGRFGFTLSPWTRVSLTAQYKHRNKDSNYDHLRDEQFGLKNEGYSAFITSRNTESDEVSVKLTVRPANWLKASLTYQKIATDYTTGTDSLILPEIEIPGLPTIPAQVITPGGTLFAGNYDADVYGLNFTFVPWQRLSLSSTFSYRNSRTTTEHAGTDAVVAYDGEMFSAISSATFALNEKTEITGGYTFSWADYGQDNFATGLPVGLAYDWHIVSGAITRRFRHNISATLQYRFYYYDEFRTTGFNNYTAHGVLAAMTIPL